MDFEKVLASLISGQLGYTGNGTELAEKITVGVADALKEQAMGFVPDNLRWRLLLNLVREHHRFVLAIMWGNCSPVYLATAPDKEIHNRVSLMNSQPQDDFDAQLRRSASAPDPSVCPALIAPISLQYVPKHFTLERKPKLTCNRTCIVILIGLGRNQPELMKMPKPCGKPSITGRNAVFGYRLGQIMRFRKATARPNKRIWILSHCGLQSNFPFVFAA